VSESDLMDAVVLTSKHCLEYKRVPIPVPVVGQMLVRTIYAGICGSDVHAYHGLQPSLTYPRVMGHELVAEVIKINGPCSIKIGAHVVIDPSYRCGICDRCVSGKGNICDQLKVLGVHCDGGFAQYFVCDIAMAHLLPEGISDECAVFCEPLSIAVHATRRMCTPICDTALIIGAGPIGLALLLAIKRVCKRTIILDILENRLEAARNIGADLVLNSAKNPEDLESMILATIKRPADIVFDTVSNPSSVQNDELLVKRGGEVIIVGLSNRETGIHLLPILKKELTINGTRMTTHQDFSDALTLLQKIDPQRIRHIITNTFALSEAIEGIKFVEQHPEKGIKTIITFNNREKA